MAKKLTQREQARKQRDDELEKLAAQAKDLHRKAAKSEKSALALGRILVEVRDYNPHGGLTLWIQENIGKDKSTLNRCKYAISLADPKSERNNKKKKAAKRVHRENLEIIRASASTLLTSADKGDIEGATAARDKIITTVDDVMKQTELAWHKKARRLHLDKIIADGKQMSPSAPAELATLPETTDEEKHSWTRPWKVSAAAAGVGAAAAGESSIKRTGEFQMFTKEELPDRGMDEWAGMPEYVSDNLKPIQTVKVHFEKVEHRNAFANLIRQTLTDKTRYVWYPEMQEMSTARLRYVEEEEKNDTANDLQEEADDGIEVVKQ